MPMVKESPEDNTLFGWPRGWTMSLDGGDFLDDELHRIREKGFEDIEIRPSWPTLDWRNRSELLKWKTRLQRAGLRVRSLHAGFEGGDFTSADARARVRSLARHKRAVDVLQALGGDLYVVDLGALAEEGKVSGTWLVRALRGLTRVAAKCKEKGVHLVVGGSLPEENDREAVQWIFERLPMDDDLGVSVDLDCDASRHHWLKLAERRPVHLRRVEVNESSMAASQAVRSYQEGLDNLLRRAASDGLLVVKPAYPRALGVPHRTSPGAWMRVDRRHLRERT